MFFQGTKMPFQSKWDWECHRKPYNFWTFCCLNIYAPAITSRKTCIQVNSSIERYHPHLMNYLMFCLTIFLSFVSLLVAQVMGSNGCSWSFGISQYSGILLALWIWDYYRARDWPLETWNQWQHLDCHSQAYEEQQSLNSSTTWLVHPPAGSIVSYAVLVWKL